MPRLYNTVDGKQLYSLNSGCFIIQTTANEVGYCDETKTNYVDISGGNSGGSNRSFYFEVKEGYLVLPSSSSEFSMIRLDQQFSRFKFDRIS